MLRARMCARRRELGMSMIELLIAMTVLAIGMAGIMILISGAIASNSRNRLDTTATTLSEMVMERIVAVGPKSTTTFTITDCNGTSFTIDPAGADAPGRGATLNNNEVSFSSLTSGTPTTGYTMRYVACGSGGSQATYDVRWNVTNFKKVGTTVLSKYVTVSARQVGGAGTGRELLKYFAPPVTLRTMVTN